jgi:xanthine/uracil permease
MLAAVEAAGSPARIKGIGVVAWCDRDSLIGCACIADGLATEVVGVGVAIYAENMGVMAVTRVCS